METSYYAMLDKIKYPVSIAGKAPDFYEQKGLPQYKKLAPKWAFFNEWKNGSHKGDNDYYIENYNNLVLSKLDVNQVVADIQAFYPNVPLEQITLLCYEKPGDFCHRHLVADWLTKNGFPTEEKKFVKRLNA